MAANKKLLMLPGDGIGPEVMKQVLTILVWKDKRRHVSFDVAEDVVGGAAIDKYGQPLGDNTLADAMGVDAVLLGAVGGPKWDNVERDLRPEMGLLTLRKEMDLYANLRPATVLPAMAKASSLKEDLVSGLDMLIVRELTGGVYFGKPRGIEKLADGTRKAVDTQIYSEGEIARVCRLAFELAGKRSGKLHSVEKANVMETGVLWRAVATEVGADFPDIELNH
ncbi:MAG: isocitrate/isopropylmalate family dehydrogenase, partial [Rhodospirillales bacterium]